MSAASDLPVADRAAWRAWLAEHHASSAGVWVVCGKQRSAVPHVPYGELVEEALCFGWIDAGKRAIDDERTGLLMRPRRPGGTWSASNRERIARLEAAGLLAPAGATVLAQARADGSFDALKASDALVEPDDLVAALDAVAGARAGWDAFTPAARRAMLEWIGSAKRPETRERRIAKTAEDAARGVKAFER